MPSWVPASWHPRCVEGEHEPCMEITEGAHWLTELTCNCKKCWAIVRFLKRQDAAA